METATVCTSPPDSRSERRSIFISTGNLSRNSDGGCCDEQVIPGTSAREGAVTCRAYSPVYLPNDCPAFAPHFLKHLCSLNEANPRSQFLKGHGPSKGGMMA